MMTNVSEMLKYLAMTAGAAAASAGLSASAATPAADSQKAEPQRPNVLFIIAEDMTLDLSCYGRTDVRTPNLDCLASEGVLYTNARCAAPLSSPTRSAMMTGLHQVITGAHNHRSNRDKPLPADITPFPTPRWLLTSTMRRNLPAHRGNSSSTPGIHSHIAGVRT